MNVTSTVLAALALPLALLAVAPPALVPATPEAPASEAPAPAAPAPPTPVALPTLARSLESALARVALMEPLVEPSAATVRIHGALPEATARMTEMEMRLRSLDPDDVAFRELDVMRVAWLELDSRLADWESSLESDAKALDDAHRELLAIEETWRATQSAERTFPLPPVLLDKIDTLLTRTAKLQETLGARVTSHLLVQDAVSSSRAHVREALVRLNALSGEVGERMFAVERDPLWLALSTERPTFPLATQALESWRVAAGELARTLRRDQARLVFLLVLFGVVAAGGAYLASRVRRDPAADAAAKEAAALLDRPVAASSILALFSTLWIYPPTAYALHAAALTLLLIPYFRFVPKLKHPSLRGLAYNFGALFFLDRFHDFAIPHSLLQRVLLLAIGVVAILLWLRAMRIHAADRLGWSMPLRVAVRIAIGFLAIAIVANVVGNVSLAEQLTVVAVKGAFAGAVLYIVARILESLYVLLLRYAASQGVRMVVRNGPMLERRGRRTIGVLALGTWIVFMLWIMRVIEQSGQLIVALMRKQWALGQVHVGLGSIIAFILALTAGILIARLLRFLLDEAVFPRMTLPRGVPAAISTTVGYVIVTVAFVTAILAAGLEMKQFAFLAGALGVGIGFGLQNVVNNFVSGLILLYERPIQVGDVLEVGTLRGRVRRIGIRSSTLATFEGAEVIVPNASLIAAEVVNWTLSDRVRRVQITVGVGYGSDPRKVVEILNRVAREHPEVLAAPEPVALFVGFGDSSLSFELQFWIADYDTWVKVASDVRTGIAAAFKEAGIEIPFPQRDLHVRSVPQAASAAEWAQTGAPPPPRGK